MSQIPLKETYTPTLVYDDPNNPQAARTVTYWTSYTFESSTLAVSANAGNYDGSPLPDYSVVGEFYWDCAGTVRQSYVHDGNGGYTVAPEADSLSCGYVPASPLTCDMVLAPVVLTDTVAGTTAQAVVTTAHGRVHYRLDGGAEQLSPYFYNVAPGAHLLAVRDDGVANCRRSRSFTVAAASPPAVPPGAPAGLDFVGQPLWCSVPAPAGAEVLVELWAETAHGAEDFGRVFVSRKQASLTGGVSTRLDTLLWPLLKAFVPAATAVATATQVCRTNLLNYFVRTVVLVPGRAAAYQTLPLRTAVRGALPAEWRGLDYFAYRLDAYGPPPFLSWQPAGKRITAEQPEWLFWLCPSSQPPVLTVRRSYVRTGFAGGAPLVEDEAVNLNAGRGPKGRLLAIPVKR